jgi:predicted acetyltransferase
MRHEIRTIDTAELGSWVRQRGTGFLHLEPEAMAEFMRESAVDLDRTWAAFDGSRVVGTLRSFGTELTVPGNGALSAAALTNVTVASTHRRQGLLTGMIMADLRRSAELGEAVGILIASEYPIYGRFGYGAAIEGARYSVRTPGTRFREPATGSVELVDPAELRKLAPPLYETYRVGQPGAIGRSDRWWDRQLQQVEVPGAEPWKGFQAVYRAPTGEVEGYVRYVGKQEWTGMLPHGTLQVEELLSVTPAAYRALWGYCCDVDLITTVESGTRATDEVLPLLVEDARQVVLEGRHDFVWVRILDPRAALAGRRYRAEGRLVIEIVDGGGLAGGRFALVAAEGDAGCEATTAAPDLTVGASALGSAFMGAVSFDRLRAAGLLEEHRAGAVARADLLFMEPRAPWCATWF